jgi:glutamine amidotransferase
MSKQVAVVDYGVGNLLSVRRALEHCGATVAVTSDPVELARADALVLPGVGAFADGMRGLRERGLVEPLQACARGGKPFLGICLGMQLMFELGREHGEHAGLGLVAGSVEAIPAAARRKIPHIGWAELQLSAPRADWRGSVLAGATPGASSVYFVHSYHAVPRDSADLLAVCDYAGFAVTAAISRGNLHGCQFHPEKSGEAGLGIVRGFLALA